MDGRKDKTDRHIAERGGGRLRDEPKECLCRRLIDTRRERDKQTNALTDRETDVMTDGRTDKTLSFIILT